MDNRNKEIITKRIQTTMIGALHEFEKTFGYLWGCQKEEDEDLTDREYKFLDLWEDARNKILNNGNNQLRKCISELEKSEGTKIKYNYNFKRKRNDNEN